MTTARKPPKQTTFGSYLKEIMKRHKIPLSSMIVKCCLPAPVIESIRADREPPPEWLIQRVHHEWGADLDWLYEIAGVIGDDTKPYFRQNPAAVSLVRLLIRTQPTEEQLRHLYDMAASFTAPDEPGPKSGKAPGKPRK